MPNCGSKMWQHRQMLSGENIQNLRILTEPELLKKKKKQKEKNLFFSSFQNKQDKKQLYF